VSPFGTADLTTERTAVEATEHSPHLSAHSATLPAAVQAAYIATHHAPLCTAEFTADTAAVDAAIRATQCSAIRPALHVSLCPADCGTLYTALFMPYSRAVRAANALALGSALGFAKWPAHQSTECSAFCVTNCAAHY
jgi:hypothetical protein